MKNFDIKPDAENARVTVTLISQLPFPPTPEEQETLAALVEVYDRIFVDIRQTDTLSTQWIRLLADLTEIAEAVTRELFVVGANDAIKSTTDIVNLADHIRMFDSMEDVPN